MAWTGRSCPIGGRERHFTNMAAHSNEKPMMSVYCRMISPALRQGPFTVPTAQFTIRALMNAADLPQPSTAPVLVRLQLVRSHDDTEVAHEVVLDASHSPIGTWRWWMRCPECHTRRQALYVRGPWLVCRECCGLRYGTQAISSARRRSELFGRQRAALEARPGRRSRRWGWLVVQEREEALRLLN